MGRNSSPTGLRASSCASWPEAVDPKTLVKSDSNSDGTGGSHSSPRGPWMKSCMSRSANGGENGPTPATIVRNAFDFVVRSVHFSWQALSECYARPWHTKSIPTMSNQTSTLETSSDQTSTPPRPIKPPAERDALTRTLERDLQRIDRRTSRAGPTRRAAAEATVADAEPPLWIALSMPTPTKILTPRRSAPRCSYT